jgi:transcriptional regulator with GAF, ATPase, and Fis domain
LALTGRVVRNDEDGCGVSFASLGREALAKIWGSLQTLIPEGHCPYCNHALGAGEAECPACGWDLHFANREYIGYWEKESTYRLLVESLRKADLATLQRISRLLQGEALAGAEEAEEFVGTCPAMKEVFSLIRKVAPTDLPVLILGESGTGKELTARAIHERSARKDRPFVAINCSAIPESLLEAELFGYVKGAFTGAYTNKKGKLEYADTGTLFLDEIGDFPPALQPKLLRFLEDPLIEAIGSRKGVRVDVRIIVATNRDIEKAVAEESFRSDLYHRIRVFTLALPPLRERGDDQMILAQYFFKKFKREGGWSCRGFTPEALEAIRHHPWPGNVREMINRIRRAIVVQDEWITPEDLELLPRPLGNQRPRLREAYQGWKKEVIQSALSENRYNISQTARSLGISRTYLHQLIKKGAIPLPGRRGGG